MKSWEKENLWHALVFISLFRNGLTWCSQQQQQKYYNIYTITSRSELWRTQFSQLYSNAALLNICPVGNKDQPINVPISVWFSSDLFFTFPFANDYYSFY